jgi:ABC-type branched-subunit amino acid transport system ATPase component/branched-subunit amino acid ABC-type transport system permease component
VRVKDLLPFIVAGIASGAIYGLAASGLVLTYKTSGIFNFGHGALATAAAYVFYWLHIDHELDWKLAMFVSVLIVGPLMGLVMEFVARELSHQRMAWKVVGTAGLILIVQGLGTLQYGTDSRRVPQYLPKGNEFFRFADVNIRWSQVIVVVIAVVCVAALYALFRYTRLGIAMRAVVDDPDLVDLQGTSPVRVRRISWIIGSTLAALSGVLIVPFLGLESITLTFLVVQTFGAAAIGLFSSIPLTFVGGLLIGIGENLLTKYEIDNSTLVGLSKSLPFLVLIAVMILTPKRKLLPPSTTVTRPPLQWRGPPTLRIAGYVVVFGFLASVPLWAPNTKLTPYWTGALSTVVIMLSLGLLVRTAGIVSLCTGTFAAIGAVAFSQLAVDHGMPWFLAIFLAGLFAIPAGAIIAIPSIRLSGLFLALATLGFGLLVERLLYRRDFMFSESAQGRSMPRPSFADTDAKYYYVVLAFVVLAVIVIGAIHRGRLGRILLGMGESPTAVGTLGLSINVTRIIVFCIGAYIAAIAGVLQGAMLQVAGAESSYYSTFNSIILLAILALAPFRVPWYAIFAGITQVIPGYLTGDNTTHWLNVLFGFFAILVACQGGPQGMPIKLQRFFESKFGRSQAGSRMRAPAEESNVDLRRPVPEVPAGAIAGLTVENVSVRFGGLLATDNVSLQAPMGRITGLIGPNGAGKTTTFNACSGLNRPTQGRVLLHGRDVSKLSPNARARAGLGRTFQIMELCESLTVADNVALGRESSQAGSNPLSQIIASPNDVRVRDLATKEALELCGVSDLAPLQAGALSTGQRRLVELARCLAGPFDILLLDEPSSGLDKEESARFAELLKRIVRERGCGVLLVEHDVALVMDVCQYIYVLDFGKLIFEGTPEDVAGSADVQAAYLGSETEHLAELEEELHSGEANAAADGDLRTEEATL